MSAKEIIAVSICAVMLFVAGMFVGYVIPKCHGPRGFHHEMMMKDKGCPCKGKDCKCDMQKKGKWGSKHERKGKKDSEASGKK